MKRLATLLVLGLLALGCKYYPPDTDNTQSTALRLIPGVPIQDSINPAQSDSVDWRMFVSDKDVRVNVVYTVGEAYKPHNVRGEIIVFDRPGNIIARKPIVPGKRDYTIMFTARKQSPYYFELRADSGASGYLINCTTEPLDPCSKCGPGTTCCLPTGVCCQQGTKCVAGQCINRNVCNPPCAGWQVCEEGVCVSACPHKCRRGYRCDTRLRQCIRTHKTHHVTPRRPRCGPSQTYDPRQGRCISNQPAPTGHQIPATILNVNNGPSGGVLIVVDRGYKDGVRKGNTARVGRYSLSLYRLFRTRSVWKSRTLTPVKIGRYKTITIFGE